MRLRDTDFALPAVVFCSLTSGIQKSNIFSYTEKFGLVMLTILAAAKNFAMKLFVKQLNCFTKLQSRALQPVLRTTILSQRSPMSDDHLV